MKFLAMPYRQWDDGVSSQVPARAIEKLPRTPQDHERMTPCQRIDVQKREAL